MDLVLNHFLGIEHPWFLKVKEKEIFFTSGGTESDNWALVGTAMANKRTGNHIITSAIEHPAVSAPLAFLEEQGFRITRLPVNKEGLVDVNELEEAITPETILVSIMYVNNEIGAVEPIGEIGRRIKAKNPKRIFMSMRSRRSANTGLSERMGIDMLSVSGHKIHGPKGSGFLYIDEKVKIPSADLRRRPAERHAFRNRQCAGHRRPCEIR